MGSMNRHSTQLLDLSMHEQSSFVIASIYLPADGWHGVHTPILQGGMELEGVERLSSKSCEPVPVWSNTCVSLFFVMPLKPGVE